MQTGFSHGVAPTLIERNPGRPARFYARTALKQNLAGSDAKDREFSLASTLAKEVRERRLPGIEARTVGGVLCYFPSNLQ
jgi:hypothetical protein